MKVVFIKTLKGTAKLHDVKEVADGYAQNFLIPNGYVVRATDEKIKEVANGKQLIAETDQRKFNELKDLLHRISQTSSIVFKDHPHAKGRLYNAVTVQEICHAFQTQHNIFITKNTILDYEPIHETGEHEIVLGDKKQSIIYRISVI